MAEEETKQPTTTTPTWQSLQDEIGKLATEKMLEPKASDLKPPRAFYGYGHQLYEGFGTSTHFEEIKRQVSRVVNHLEPPSDETGKKAFAYAKKNIRLFYDDETWNKINELSKKQKMLPAKLGGRKRRKSRRKTRRGGKRKIYRVKAVKAWLKRTKRRRKKRKTKKKKKKTRRRRTRR